VTTLRGSAECLRWARRDLEHLNLAIAHCRYQRVAVQAGGNLGVFAEHLSKLFLAVYTFEPDPVLFSHLCHNIGQVPNIIKLQAALGARHELVGTSSKRRDGKPTIHEGVTHVAGPGIIPTLRIDDLELPVCDLIYLDVEGWEFHAVRGALETMKRCRPVIGVEINRNLELCGFTPEDLRTLIATQGYKHELTIRSDEIFVPVEW
jgi:FkbM family methyltransferase